MQRLCHAYTTCFNIADIFVCGAVYNGATRLEGGVEVVEDEESKQDSEDFAAHDELFSDLAMAALPMVDPACTLRSTQQSNPEDPDATQLVSRSDSESDPHDENAAPEGAAETETSSFDIVSDSNDESEDGSFYWDVTEE
ncbi:unnamed protein product [Phytophthora lilii]|uniref:Unnamed protein product n=1 Tax=Phytophthora lilii TaxID=2077276 RepID=A0A9W6TEY6_9STRA|nr:unnamed protein product [Phytophthora lilii]